MKKIKETEYKPLEFEEIDIEPVSRPLKRSPSILGVVIWLEVANVVVFALLYALWNTSRIHYQWGYGMCSLLYESASNLTDIHLDLDGMPLKYNVSRTFTVDRQDLSLVKNTPEANNYWMNITFDRRNGLVSLPTDWAKKYELKPSAQKTKNGESVFQVDMFHQLHCLVWGCDDVQGNIELTIDLGAYSRLYS
jgi:hypothetical protein